MREGDGGKRVNLNGGREAGVDEVARSVADQEELFLKRQKSKAFFVESRTYPIGC